MRRASLILAASLAAVCASAHLCNNIYRTPDRLIVKPEKQVINLDRADRFRVFVQNNYPTLVHNLSLSAQCEGGGVDVRVSPASVAEVAAGQRVSFQVDVTAAAGASGGTRQLSFGITAQEVGFRPLHEVSNDELNAAFGEGNFSSHVLVATSLAQRKDPRGLAKLRTMTDDRGHRALGLCGDPAAAPIARERLAAQQHDGWQQGNLLLALGLLHEPRATIEPYLTHRDAFVRTSAQAALVLAGSRDRALTEPLQAALRHDDVLVRIAAAWALGATLRDRGAMDVLDQAFRPDNPQSRVFAGDALVDIASRTGGVVAESAPAAAPQTAPQPTPAPVPARTPARPAAPAPAPADSDLPSTGRVLLVAALAFLVTGGVLLALARKPKRRSVLKPPTRRG